MATDLFLAVVCLSLLSPILLVLAFLVWLNLGNPIFFRQIRPGYKGKPFVIYKFRTMKNTSDGMGKYLPDAERLTRFGRWLRHSSLDELPELINVLRAEMSLVGPRPLLMEYLDRYTPEQFRRHDMRPGITGLAQVMGRNAIPFSARIAYDTWYIDNFSLWLDFKILVMTVLKVTTGSLYDGAGQDVKLVDDLGLHRDHDLAANIPHRNTPSAT